ncbi:hypothetical protein ACPPVV_18725 [Rhodanobacter sp. Col0626]|uniref:hypothetical protein n=1 Tax=Rhodanobacter sp. Col0626 TaxID=3415679 RepID=UPI003CE9A548
MKTHVARLQTLVLTILFASSGHAACPTARLAEIEVLAIANHKAEASGIDLSNYRAPKAHYEYIPKDCAWSVSYEGIKQDFGNVFFVVVNDNTRAAELELGL